MQWRRCSMVIVDMINVNREPLHCLSNAGVPSTIVYCTAEIIRAAQFYISTTIISRLAMKKVRWKVYQLTPEDMARIWSAA